MAKKKGAIAAKARARKEAKARAKSPSPTRASADGTTGPIVPSDGQRVRRGLQNLGNTCFMNSIVQCLNVSLPFSDELMGLMADGLEGIPRSLNVVFRGIRGTEAATGSKGSFNPKPLREELISHFPWYAGKEQQDAHELLRTLLGNISEEATKSERMQSAEETAGACGKCVYSSFRGHICAATLCWGCNRVSLRLDPFLDLSLDLPPTAASGQEVGALGVTAAMASGKPEPPLPSETAEDGEQSGGEAGNSKADRKERKRRGKDAAVKSKLEAAPKPKSGPKGIWAARSELEDARDAAKLVVGRLILRLLGNDTPVVDDEKAEEATVDELVTTEVELKRQSRKLDPNWGFMWSEKQLEEGSFVLAGIKEDSLLEKWNLKKRAMGDSELIICIGDSLVEVNGVCEMTEIRKTLKHEDKVKLKFVRGKGVQGDLGVRKEETDNEAERKAEQKEQLRREFCAHAEKCHKELPPPLAEIFGPEKVSKAANGHLQLDDCLRRFSAVEALEDDFKPVYSCSECSKTAKVKTYASRRLWIWQADLPPLLTLQLKRFRRYGSRFEKSTATIALPTTINLGDFVLSESELQSMQPFVVRSPEQTKLGDGAPTLVYELYGICVHQGSTMASGHYVAYVNSGASLEKEAWFGISDTQVWSCPRAEVLKAQAYIAFYRREGSGEAFMAAAAANATTVKAEEPLEEAEDADAEPGDEADEADEAE